MIERARRNSTVVLWAVIWIITALIAVGFTLDLAERAASNRSIGATNFLVKLRETYDLLVQMQNSARGYVISGQEYFLDPYRKAAEELPALWTRLRSEAGEYDPPGSSDTELVLRLPELQRRAEEWKTAFQDPVIGLRRAGRVQEAVNRVATGQGKQLFDQVTAASDAVAAHINEHIALYTRELNRLRTLRQILLLGLASFALGSALYGVRLIRRESELQRRDTQASEREREVLLTVLHNLPVAVRLLGAPNAHLILQNPAADALIPGDDWNRIDPAERAQHYGYCSADGSPIPFDQIPSIRTLREGVTVTDFEAMLQSPGHETRRILISTSPLRDDKGNITAVVVVLQDVTRMRELDSRKDEFIATAAHELRNPLAALVGHLQLLQRQIERGEPPDKLSRRFTDMSRQLKRLNALVEHLLDASRIHLGRLVLDKSRVDITKLAQAAMADAEMADGGMHTIELVAPPENIIGVWDATRVDQVLTNLLSNALRYSPSSTTVQIRIRQEGDAVRVEVADQGPGVPEEQRPALFDRYYQAQDPSKSRPPAPSEGPLPPVKRRGLGLGLYISKEIVAAHGGQIGMEPGPGGGSIFWFTLPLDHAGER